MRGAVLVFLAAGSTLSAISLLAGIDGLMILSGYLFIVSAIAAWYTASALPWITMGMASGDKPDY